MKRTDYLTRNLAMIVVTVLGLLAIVKELSPTVQAQGGSFGFQVVAEQFTLTLLNGANGPQAAVANDTNLGVGRTVVRSIGQGSHWFYYCPPPAVAAIKTEAEGSFDGITWTAISEQDTDTTCTTLEAGGYWPQVRLEMLSATTTGATTVAVNYGASGGTIPGDGPANGNKRIQPVNLVPLGPTQFNNSNLKSASQTISTSPISIYSVSLSNPNASQVFVQLSCNNNSPFLQWVVPANNGRDISFNSGQQCQNTSVIACSTSVGDIGDPATGCIVNVHFKGNLTVNTNVNSGGSSSSPRSQYAP